MFCIKMILICSWRDLMFGYVNIYKDELKVKEYNDFRAYYCGLCKALGKKYNQLTRLGLSYDLTFLCVLVDSIYDEPAKFENVGCIKSISKKKTVINNKFIDYACDMSIILTYYKLLDDIHDNHSIKAFFAILPYRFSMRKLKGKYETLIDNIKDNLKQLADIEKQKCDITDKAAHPFATIMSGIFSNANPALENLGYNIGRYVFFADALDDMDNDLKSGNYNVFNICYKYNGNISDAHKKQISDTMLLTLSFIASEYEKLPKFKNKEIIDNIIYIGLRAKVQSLIDSIGKNKKGNKND